MNLFRATVVGFICAASLVIVGAQAGLGGKWQGETASGRQVVLDAKVEGKQLTGTFTLAQQSADITEGTVEGKTLSFKMTIEGRTVTCKGRLIDESLELTVEGVPNPVLLKRVKK